MSKSCVIFEVRESVACVTVNRPGEGNVVDEELAEELRSVLVGAGQNGAIKAVILQGSGKDFCLGNEIEYKASGSRVRPGDISKMLGRYSVCEAIAALRCPVLCALNGRALGAGVEIALACDVRIAASSAEFGFPNVASGVLCMDGGTQRLARTIGRGKSLELLLTGELIGAEEALRIGLVNRMVSVEQLTPEVTEMARKITEKAPVALKFAKEAVYKGLDLTLDQGLRLEADLYFLIHTTSDRAEGITAFREKKKPDFCGQ